MQVLESETTLDTIAGPWAVTFPLNSGAPASIEMPELISWTASSDPRVKYFAGAADYVKDVRPAVWFRPGQHPFLALDEVRDLADVSVNRKPVGLVWAPPYRLDVTLALKPGMNKIEIKVTNEWTNRIVGDLLMPPESRILSKGDACPVWEWCVRSPEPAESGLVGSAKLVAERVRKERYRGEEGWFPDREERHESKHAIAVIGSAGEGGKDRFLL